MRTSQLWRKDMTSGSSLFTGGQIMVEQFPPFWTTSVAVSRCIHENEGAWRSTYAIETQGPGSSLEVFQYICVFKIMMQIRTALLLVSTKSFLPNTAFSKLDFPTFARPNAVCQLRTHETFEKRTSHHNLCISSTISSLMLQKNSCRHTSGKPCNVGSPLLTVRPSPISSAVCTSVNTSFAFLEAC